MGAEAVGCVFGAQPLGLAAVSEAGSDLKSLAHGT